MTEIANPTLGKVEDLFQDLVWDNFVTGALAALFVAVPALAIWPLKTIITFIVKKFSDELFTLMRLGIDLSAITFTNVAHRKTFDAHAVKLKLIERDSGLDSDEYKKAKADAKLKMSEYTRFRGAA